ncbi:MAG: Gar1/Naf1 family protein [Candidatus Bathyarchaeota archaeon]|nr:Gar1/Naf1 family protein [Candidatus Bathyarchaeota archaeon]
MKSRIRLGTALHLSSSSGNLILETDEEAKIGEDVLDNAGKKVGTIFDLFGPLSNPFVAVKPRIDNPERLLGEDLFLRKRKG